MPIFTLKKVSELVDESPSPAGMLTKVIAIDGCGGAGKSTLSKRLSSILNNCSVIHTDDFASWDNPLGWYGSMIQQVLVPLQENRDAIFQRYDWNTKTLEEWITIHPQKFVIIEGVSSARKEFRSFLTYSIFVQTSREIRLQRGLARDGEEAESQWLKWMQEEDAYVSRDRVEDYVDLILSGETVVSSSDEILVLRSKDHGAVES